MTWYSSIPLFLRIILLLVILEVIEGYIHEFKPEYYWSIFVITIGLSMYILYRWLSPLEAERAQSQEQEYRLKSVLDTVNTAIVTINEVGIIASFNEAAQRIFGYGEEEVIGKNVKILMPDEHKHRHDGYLHKYKETGDASIIGLGRELVGVRKNGETFPLFLHVGQVDLAHGRMFTGVLEDLSALKASQQQEKDTRQALENEALRTAEQQQLLKSVLTTVSTAIATITEGGIVESFNEAAQRIFGYSEEEVIGKNVKMLMPDEHKHRHDGYLKKYGETGQASIIGLGRELVGVRKSGETFPLFLHVGEVNLGSRRIFTGVMEDLSKLKASEEAEKETRLKLEEEVIKAAEQKVRLESIVNTVGTAIITISNKGIIESFNESAQRIFGYSDVEVFGKNVKILMPDEHRHRHDGYLREYGKTGNANIIGVGRELIGVRKNGEEFPMHLHVGQVNLDDRTIFTGAIEDLSDLKQAQVTEREARQALEQEKVRLEEQDWIKTSFVSVVADLRATSDMKTLSEVLLDNLLPLLGAQLGVFYFDEELEDQRGLLTRYGTYGYTQANSLSKTISRKEGLVGEVIKAATLIHLKEVPEDYVYRVGSSLGESAPKEVMIVPIMFEGTALAVIEVAGLQSFNARQSELLLQVSENLGIVINRIKSNVRTEELLTETQKQAEQLKANEEELRVGNEELARQSAEMEERNRMLEEAQTELEETSRYKSEFLANMSHELRTPLNSLLILSKMLSDNKDGNLTASQVKNASTIYHSGNDLLSLINDILDLSKVEAGQMMLNISPLPLSHLSSEIEESFGPIAEQNNVGFSITVDDKLPDVILTDEQRLAQILRNFLSNGFKFTKKGEVSLSIRLATESDNLQKAKLKQSGAVAFVVSDTGIGIPKNKQEMIFLAFQQIDSSIQREYGGTGLGLSISKQLADLLDGEVHVDSAKGKGSTFTFFLPLTSSSSHEVSQSAQHIRTLAIAPKVTDIRDTTPLVDDRNNLRSDKKTILLMEDDPKFALIVADLVRDNGFNIVVCEDGADGYMLAKDIKPIGVIVDLSLSGLSGQSAISCLKDDPLTRHIPVHVVAGTGNTDELKGRGIIGFMQKPVSQEQLVSILDRFVSIAKKPVRELLLVEDNEVQAEHIKELLGNKDINVTLASSAQAARDSLNEQAFDCMVLDFTLPDLDGLGLLKSLSQHDQLNDLPVIVYTAKDLTSEEQKELKVYAEDIIQKGEKGADKLLDEVALFLHRVEAKLPDKQREILKKVHDVEAILSHKKVLLVDDDMRNIYALSAALEDKNMEVIVAKNGIEALEKLDEHQDVNIILMDIMMPEMDGYEAMGRIREAGPHQNTPIIALTAKAMAGDREQCIDAGASDYISKPIEIERLFSLMRIWLY
ncbi:PAS domain S-box protein [Alteromonadaceae bacterium M269]|nr:PAS domain S-box protein [Alteromonadaceae bacterium M269]